MEGQILPFLYIDHIMVTFIFICIILQQVKDEFAMGIHEGGNDSSSQFEDDGEDFDYGSENVSISIYI